ncbi:uncharacterized protein K02A2.6-like [Frankliniella occidentalis]|uniref:RNA-directed DNA polymerase n=1 Tax=Frankliniella occidentalis TaxID=133901 RepID=A0A6J1SBB3_FRAOC|nr:uncharacterized protein K02A2.6-like [Frankliniella occidentalis]
MATFGANIPAPLSFEGDVAANWKKFHKNFKIYLGATGREKSAADVAAMNEGAKKDYYDSLGKLLLNIAGDEATTVSSSFGLNDDEEFNYIELVKKFEEYSAEDDNETYIRFMFNRTRQRDGETFDHFVAEARKRIKACGYGNLEDSLLKDRIVEGVRSQKLQQTLLAIKNLDLKTAISEGRSAESSTRYVSEIQQELASTVSVNAVRNHKQYKSQDKGQYKNQDKGFKKPDKQEFDCTRCGYSHTYGKCPAYGKTCVKCKGRNHFAKMCKTQAVHNVQVEENDQNNLNNFDYQVLFADSIGMEVITLNSLASQKAKPPQEYRQEIKVGNKIINFKLDPGSPASIIPPEELEALNIEESAIIPANIYIKPFGPDSPVIKAVGRVKILTKVGGKTKLVNYIIAPGEVPLFGIADCEEFGLIVRKVMSIDSTEHAIQTSAKEEFAQKNRDVFEGLGKFPGEHPILTKPESEQVIRPALRRPKVINDKLKSALEMLETRGVIKKVDHLTPESWVSNIVIVTKPNGSIRICVDPVDLNKSILREPYLIPTVAEISERLNHQKFYTLLDLKDGFYHIELDEKSSYKCCFSTPFGIFRFLRCPFGLASAPELFQKLNEQVFGGIPNVLIYFDDVLAFGKTEEEHDKAVAAVIQRAPSFDSSKKIIIQSDASQSGVGCCLLQEGHPVAFASRALTDSEKNYSVSEKELLAITVATQKFHNFIFGYPVEVQTDHLPLVPMINKEIYKLGSKTLQRLRLKLLKYELHLVHVPGKMMFMSDLFSRTARETIEDESTMIEMVHSLSMSLPINDSLRSALVEATASDIGLQTVMKYLREGWPKHAEQLSAQAFPYFQVRNDIFCEDNLLYFNDQGQPRIIVPASLRAEVLKLVHGPAHLATDRCLSRAVQAFYWPGLSNHIQEFIKRCQICKKFLPMPAKHPLHPHPLPNLMWEAVSMDIASVGPKDYLVMYDSYSKWLEILKLPSKSASAVVDACKNVFAIHGFPQKIVCDNNPFNSFEFKSFAKECNSTIIFTSPHLHHSNGRAEKGVSIAKLILRKSIEERSDYRDSLREYRNTEIPSMGYSPAQLMFSRKMRTTLPVTNQDLKPVVPQSVKSKMLNQQRRTEKWYNKSARRTECNFQPGDPVIINLGNKGETWKEGNVIEKCKEPRSFLVQMKNGGQVRRATNHMRPDYQQSEIPWDPVYDMIRRRNVQKSLERSEQINQEREKTETNQEKDKTETNQEKDKTETNQEKDKTETNQEKDKTEKTKEKEKSEKIYQLIVPDWMFKENYVTRAGRTVKQTSSFTPS